MSSSRFKFIAKGIKNQCSKERQEKNVDQKFDYYRLKLDTCNLGDYLNGEEKLATHHPDLLEKEQTKMALCCPLTKWQIVWQTFISLRVLKNVHVQITVSKKIVRILFTKRGEFWQKSAVDWGELLANQNKNKPRKKLSYEFLWQNEYLPGRHHQQSK